MMLMTFVPLGIVLLVEDQISGYIRSNTSSTSIPTLSLEPRSNLIQNRFFLSVHRPGLPSRFVARLSKRGPQSLDGIVDILSVRVHLKQSQISTTLR